MNAAIYARYSSNEQSGTSTIDSQIRACREYAEKHGLTICDHHIYVDRAISGARDLARESFQAMVAAAKKAPKPFSKILVWKFSRFSRDRYKSAIYKGLLSHKGVEVVSVSEPIDKESAAGRLMEGVIEVIDQFYSDRLSEETTRGLRENTLCGYRGGSVAPYGYLRKIIELGGTDRRGKPITKTVIRPNKETAPIVQQMFEWYARKGPKVMGLKTIARTLNEQGVKGPRGGTWDPSTIRGIIKNEVYMGWAVRGKTKKVLRENDKYSSEKVPADRWTVNKDAHPPIIDDLTWKRAQHQAEKRRGTPSAGRPPTAYLLSGILRCGVCGGSFITQKTRMKNQKWYYYYTCGMRHRRGKVVCDNPITIPHEPFNQRFVEAVLAEVVGEKMIDEVVAAANAELAENAENLGPEIKATRAKLTRLSRKIDNCVDAIADGVERMRGRLAELEREEADTRDHLAHLETYEESQPITRKDVIAAKKAIATATTNEELREELLATIDRVVVERDSTLRLEYRPAAWFPENQVSTKGWCAARDSNPEPPD